MPGSSAEKAEIVPCCPELGLDRTCDVLDFHYRQTYSTQVTSGNVARTVPVEVVIHVRIQRCPGPLMLGDLVYTTTLLPGEKVRLFTTDRRTRFTLDSTSKVSYRNEQTSEEHFYMSSMSDFMSDLSVRDSSRSTNTNKGSAEGHGETSGVLSTIFGSPSVDVSGSYSAESTSDFLRELSQHARASHHRSEMGARASSAISVGEVQTRTHTETESEDHFESSSREFANPNKCHAVSFYFYRINKKQTIKFTLESIQRRVIDPAADTRVTNNPFASRGGVVPLPSGVLATNKERLQLEVLGRTSVAAEEAGTVSPTGGTEVSVVSPLRAQLATFQRVSVGDLPHPLPTAVREQALKQVDSLLIDAHLLGKDGGSVSPQVVRDISFELTFSLPTPGLLVKGCLDECDICEPALQREIDLGLKRKELENQLLARQIELLEKSQEYRCCPEGGAEESDAEPTP
jgi:hypothetical protein